MTYDDADVITFMLSDNFDSGGEGVTSFAEES